MDSGIASVVRKRHDRQRAPSSGAAALRQPAKERPEREADLGSEREIGGDADEDAEREAQDGPDCDGDSDAHARECMGRRDRLRVALP